MKDIYALLGVSWQTVYKWKDQLTVTQSKYYIKHNFIKRAGELFSLNDEKTEELANKAGLSLNSLNDIIADKQGNISFTRHFSDLLSIYSGKLIDLCGAAQVSERMFRYIKSGRYLRKEPVLALLITLELDFNGIQEALKTAGFVLSRSMPNDVVVIWTLENEQRKNRGYKRLYRINETLDSLDLPLLMTRCKAEGASYS